MVEFALTISVFMLLVLGTFDVARGFLVYTVVTNAVREVGRYAAANYGDATYSTQTAQQAGRNLAVGIDPAQLMLGTPTQTTIGGLPAITATGTYYFQSITPWVSVLLNPPSGGPITISVTTTTLVG
jgi:Flp pilus assembly protein TadG